jgi:hypothetical protein
MNDIFCSSTKEKKVCVEISWTRIKNDGFTLAPKPLIFQAANAVGDRTVTQNDDAA